MSSSARPLEIAALRMLPSSPLSMRIYLERVRAGLVDLGLRVEDAESEEASGADLWWNPRAGRRGPGSSLANGRKPGIVTFHGAAHLVLRRSEWKVSGHRLLRPIKAVLRKRRTQREWRSQFDPDRMQLIAVSEYARQELMLHLRVPPDRITVVYHGVDHEQFFPSEGAPGGRPYFLHVSSQTPKKNLDRLVAAHRRLPASERPLLKLVGRDIRRPLGPDVESLGPLPNDELPPLYRGALALVCPSLHETFCLPILEAMASGCPVLTSDGTACREVAGDACVAVDPRSVAQIATAMERLVSDRSQRDSLRQAGLSRAQGFSWRRAAEDHLAVIRGLLKRSGGRS